MVAFSLAGVLTRWARILEALRFNQINEPSYKIKSSFLNFLINNLLHRAMTMYSDELISVQSYFKVAAQEKQTKLFQILSER